MDAEHIHVHFIVSNCNVKNGKFFRWGMPELREMLKKIYLMDIQLKVNTISYALPYHTNKAGKAQANYAGYC